MTSSDTKIDRFEQPELEDLVIDPDKTTVNHSPDGMSVEINEVCV